MLKGRIVGLNEGRIVAFRRAKYQILQVGGMLNFQITKPLLESVKSSRSKWLQELKANKEYDQKGKGMLKTPLSC